MKLTTNNYIESWHRVLKKTYLGSRRRRRIDMVIFILTNGAEADFKSDILRASLHTGGRMTPREREIQRRRRIANDLPFFEDIDQVLVESAEVVKVMSFTKEGIWYEIRVNEEGSLVSCTCKDWQINHIPCKHIWLVYRFENYPVLDEPEDDNIPAPLPDSDDKDGEQHTSEIYRLQQEVSQLYRRFGRLWEYAKSQGNTSSTALASVRGALEIAVNKLETEDRRRNFINQPDY